MDIRRLSGEEKLKFSRIYFFAGIPFLPFLWWINVFCFLKDLSSPQSYPEFRLVRKYVILSLIGALSWTFAFVTWIIIFLKFRSTWGELGDRLSFNIPPVWEVTDLLAKDAAIGETPSIYTSSSGLRHIFISTKSGFTSQTLYISRHVDRLLHEYHSLSQCGPSKPSGFWIHGIGPLAITRTAELALHLIHRMYPGHLEMSTYTSSCSTKKHIISQVENERALVREEPKIRGAIHVHIRLVPTRGIEQSS
ncbi:unnamed protein product [Heterobilharzia americana]|nr:unnamed protein product [Heterobilharzia americana]